MHRPMRDRNRGGHFPWRWSCRCYRRWPRSEWWNWPRPGLAQVLQRSQRIRNDDLRAGACGTAPFDDGADGAPDRRGPLRKSAPVEGGSARSATNSEPRLKRAAVPWPPLRRGDRRRPIGPPITVAASRNVRFMCNSPLTRPPRDGAALSRRSLKLRPRPAVDLVVLVTLARDQHHVACRRFP